MASDTTANNETHTHTPIATDTDTQQSSSSVPPSSKSSKSIVGRECSVCHQYIGKVQYSKQQWDRSAKQRKCRQCLYNNSIDAKIEREAQAEAEAEENRKHANGTNTASSSSGSGS